MPSDTNIINDAAPEPPAFDAPPELQLTPAETCVMGIATARSGIAMLNGEMSHALLADALHHLAAAERCIDAFTGKLADDRAPIVTREPGEGE